MEKTTDTAGGAFFLAAVSGSYVGDQNGVPTGKGPVSGAIPVVGKTLAKTVGKVSVGGGLGAFHTKPTTKVNMVTVGADDIKKAGDQVKKGVDNVKKAVCSTVGLCF